MTRSTPATQRKTDEPPSDGALVVACRDGQPGASETLFRRHARFVNRLTYRLLGADGELDDVVQETFVQALSNLHKLREPDAFKAWLASIAVRSVRRTIAKRRMLERLGLRRPLEFDDSLYVTSTTSPESVARLRQLYDSLGRAGAEVRVAVLLHRVEGYTIAEVADLMGISVSTVKRRLQKGEGLVEQFDQPSSWGPSPSEVP